MALGPFIRAAPAFPVQGGRKLAEFNSKLFSGDYSTDVPSVLDV